MAFKEEKLALDHPPKPERGRDLLRITQQLVAQLRFFVTARPNPLLFHPTPAGYALDPLLAAVILNLRWVLVSILVARPRV